MKMRRLLLGLLLAIGSLTHASMNDLSPTTAQSCGLKNIFTQAFVSAVAPNPNLLYGNVGTNFLAAAAAFPQFANGSDCTNNKLELSAFWANATQESGYNPSGTQLQSLYYINELACLNVDGTIPITNTIARCAYCQVNSPSPYVQCVPSAIPTLQFFGRGPLQLSWNYNYQDFNNYIKAMVCPSGYEIFGLPAQFCSEENYLVTNPSAVAANGALALASALWFWNTQKGNAGITPHQAMQLGKGFGYTIKAINGGLECVQGAEGRPAAINRGRLFNQINTLLNVSAVGPTDCLDLPPIDLANNYCGSSYDNALCGPSTTCDGTDASCTNGGMCFALPSKNVCGANWSDAYNQYKSNNVAHYCPDGTSAACNGQTCFAMSTTNFCGTTWANACSNSQNWGTVTCPTGLDADCPVSQKCFALPLPGCSTGTCLP